MERIEYFDNIFQMNRTASQEKIDNMNNEINEYISYIKSLNLSPIEEIMMVYDRTKRLDYAGNDSSLEYRQLSEVLSSGRAVCVGYTNLFNEFLLRMGYKAAAIESRIDGVSHMHSIVEVVDDKYGINGIYNFDPTFDYSPDNNDLYAFFGRSIEEINHLKKERVPRGISNIIMKDYDNHYNEIMQEIPTRTMNIFNGFFPRPENKDRLQTIYKEGKDQTKWPKFNEPYIIQLSGLGMKARRAENIPTKVIEQIITKIKSIEYPNLTEEELDGKILQIKKANNSQFEKYYYDARLNFDIKPDDYVEEDKYPEYLEKLSRFTSEKDEETKLMHVIEYSNDQKQMVTHKLLEISNGETIVLMNGSFSSNYNFSQKFLNILVKNLSNNYSYVSSEVGKPEYFNLNIRNYIANLSNNCSFVIKDGNLDYIRSIDYTIKNVEKQGMTKK